MKRSDRLLKLLYVLFAAAFMGVLIWLYFVLVSSQEHSNEKIRDFIMHRAQMLVASYLKQIPDTEHFLRQVEANERFRAEAAKNMALLANAGNKYFYLLHYDKEKGYRYVLDGSVDEWAEYGQPFQPVNTALWEKVQRTGLPASIVQQKVEGIGLTYIYPLNRHYFFVVDFTSVELQKINGVLDPARYSLLLLLTVIILLLLLLPVLFLAINRQREKGLIDPLTRLYNRQYFNWMKEHIDSGSYDVAMLDIDRFKTVNDTFGHNVGDSVLQAVGKRLSAELRSYDVPIRYGGEEFLVLIKRESGTSSDIVVKRIYDAIRTHPVRINASLSIDVTVSIGVVEHDAHEKMPDWMKIVKQADEMLYEAKHRGRDLVAVYGKQRPDSVLLSYFSIQDYIDNERFIAFYQPIMVCGEETVSHYELLARLRDHNDEIIMPERFLSVIWGTNTYRKFCKQVVEQDIETIAAYNVRVSINFNTDDFLDSALFEMLMSLLEHHSDMVHNLVIEVLEMQRSGDSALLIKRLKQLQQHGVKIAIDDFGSGFSNYAYILELQPDMIKIDGSLVRGIEHDARKAALVASIVQISRALGIGTVAEYVETEEAALILEKTGVERLQGYWIGKPSPVVCEGAKRQDYSL
jgi:diguanylate cyclase (GGDEF)-like protein